MQPVQRRRVRGKQAPAEGLNNRETRNAVQTLVRDRWVARQMAAEASQGHERRSALRLQFSRLPDKAAVLEGMANAVPANLRAAARALLTSWRTETPIVPGEPVVPSYRGCGTMFRYSGSWSKAPDAVATQLLQQGEGMLPAVCSQLRPLEHVQQLWADFQSFVGGLQRRFHLDRVTLACELHTQVSLTTHVPNVHLHVMWDARALVMFGLTC